VHSNSPEFKKHVHVFRESKVPAVQERTSTSHTRKHMGTMVLGTCSEIVVCCEVPDGCF
jgi:hypothetical protein